MWCHAVADELRLAAGAEPTEAQMPSDFTADETVAEKQEDAAAAEPLEGLGLDTSPSVAAIAKAMVRGASLRAESQAMMRGAEVSEPQPQPQLDRGASKVGLWIG